MCRTYLSRLCAAAVVLISCASARSEPLEPPPVDFGEIESQSREELQGKHTQQLRERIAYWLAVLRDTEKRDEILSATVGLLEDYGRIDKAFYRYHFAEIVTTQAKDTWAKMKPQLKPLREVNLALAISEMTQVSIQPALTKMVSHPNAAVRYYGWTGYRKLRELILVLAGAAQHDKIMYASLRSQSKEETSPAVVGAMFKMFRTPLGGQWQVGPRQMARFRSTCFDILQAAWPIR